ncbi:MAG: MaoC/PaaZ C-terminal domain-containing protein, partial [Parvularculaceae bacterium]
SRARSARDPRDDAAPSTGHRKGELVRSLVLMSCLAAAIAIPPPAGDRELPFKAVTGAFVRGAATEGKPPHPFRYKFGELEIGKTIETGSRTIGLEDIEHFAHFTGDTFYAHMDEAAAKANPFFPGRVAHGYLILSFAAGLFVDPAPGPVLANYGLDELRFLTPVSPGDAIKVRLTAKSKKKRNDEYGEVKWDVVVVNQKAETVATYELLTMNAM